MMFSARQLRDRKILEMYEAGETLETIANETGVTTARISQIGVANGYRRGPVKPQRMTFERRQAIARAYADGIPTYVIARRYHAHPSTIRRVASELGYALRKKNQCRKYLYEPVLADYRSGMMQHEIADKYSIKMSVVTGILRRARAAAKKDAA